MRINVASQVFFLTLYFFILFLEDNWSEEIKIDETAMNNAAEEEKPEQGRCSGQFYILIKKLINFKK